MNSLPAHVATTGNMGNQEKEPDRRGFILGNRLHKTGQVPPNAETIKSTGMDKQINTFCCGLSKLS